MKQYIILFLFVVSLNNTTIYAQHESKTVLGLNLGLSTLSTSANDVTFEFVDESPSRDYIYSEFSLLSNYRPFVFKPYMRFENETGTTFDIEIHFGINSDVRTSGTHLGIMKRLTHNPEEQLNVYLGGFLGYGGAKLFLGNIYQNDLFIEINGKRTYEDFLSVYYRETQITFSPQIQLVKPLHEYVDITLNAGYRMRLSSSYGDVIFKGENFGDGDQFNEAVSLRSRNIALSVDGREQSRKLFNQSGLFVNVGLGMKIY